MACGLVVKMVMGERCAASTISQYNQINNLEVSDLIVPKDLYYNAHISWPNVKLLDKVKQSHCHLVQIKKPMELSSNVGSV